MARTVKVRIPVAIDPKGRWVAHNWSAGQAHGIDNIDQLLEMYDYDTIGPGEVLHWVTAEIPIPDPQEIAGTVEAGA